jgi:mono/diheme cytochrome c family protein
MVNLPTPIAMAVSAKGISDRVRNIQNGVNMGRRRIQILVSLTLLLVSNPGQAQQNGQAEAGFNLAQDVCAECHAVEKGAIRSPNAAAPRFEVIASSPGMTATALAAALRTSHRTMPNLMLDGDELSDVIAYILSLKSAN